MPSISTVIINRVAFGKERLVLTRRGEELVALIPAEDVQLLEAIENEIYLEDARVALKEAKKKGTIPLNALKKQLGL